MSRGTRTGQGPTTQSRGVAVGWNAYTPTWSGTIGNGTLVGGYQRVGRTIHFRIGISWGTTTTHPASSQAFGLPVQAPDTLLGVPAVGGTAAANNVSIGGGIIVPVAGGNQINVYQSFGFPFSNNTPNAWAAGHWITIVGTYQAINE